MSPSSEEALVPAHSLASYSAVRRISATRIGELLPTLHLGLQLFPALGSKRIELRVAACLRGFPLRFQPAAIFEAVEGGVKRALLELKKVAGDLLNPLRNGVAMNRPQRHDLEDQHVEGSLEELGFFFAHKAPRCSTYTLHGTACQGEN